MYELLRKINDFSLKIIWKGNEDKPFYRAHYVSKSEQHLLEDKPFWGNAVISREDFNDLLDILEEHELEFVPGNDADEKNGYYLEITAGEQRCNCYLGSAGDSLQVLSHILDILDEEKAKPLMAIIGRLTGIKK